MNSIPMSLLVYDNPPEYKTVGSYRTYLREKSNYSCAYCSISEAESSGATFNIDHFRPKSLFPKLETQCRNLRYSCPRCNSYKSNNWISKEDGCINDCSECKQHVCKDNIERFVDVLIEDPSKIMYLKDDDKLYAYSGSKVGEYTIDYLRLNRMQLVRLRHVRRFMDNWERLLCDKLSCVEKEIQSIQSQLIEFKNNSTMEEISKNIILTLFEMLEAQQENSRIFIEQELSNLRHLKNTMQGRDDKYLPKAD